MAGLLDETSRTWSPTATTRPHLSGDECRMGGPPSPVGVHGELLLGVQSELAGDESGKNGFDMVCR